MQGSPPDGTLQFTFPNDQNPPSIGLQCRLGGHVALPVALQLRCPEGDICPGNTCPNTTTLPMLMPKAAAYLNNRPIHRQNDIRPTWQALSVQPVTEPLTVQVAPN